MANPEAGTIRCPMPGPLPGDLDLDDPRPVHWMTLSNGVGAWVVSDYRLGREVLADRRFTRSEAVRSDVPKLTTVDPAPDSIISLDGPAHARLRRIVAGAFTERRIADLQPEIERIAGELLDAMTAEVAPVDFVSAFASPLPLHVLCRMLGIPLTDYAQFQTWVPVLFDLAGDGADSRTSAFRITHYMTKLVGLKRREPADDLLTALVQATDEGGRLTNRELVTLALSLLMAGYDSTGDQIALSILSLLQDKPRMQALRERPGTIPAEVEELLRTNPSAPASFTRMTRETVNLRNVVIEPGQPVVVFLMAANRGVSEGETSSGGPMPHLTFGHGIHRCLGAPLARLQLATALRLVSERLPTLALAEDPDRLLWKTGSATRGLTRMNVTW
ncbi:cytochrome P450 [Kitasatospora sp. NPDC036755]|uniref:cytochrome P450 n=1 Tax=Kitasatospora sp. NPDC036755 TaxID=3154600 RepID=UPI0033F43DE8